jgi:carboxyl-terminal processing protease
MRPIVRRALGAAAAVTALAAAFTAGVVAGAGSTERDPAPSGASRLDEAAEEIAAAALREVDREALDAAAIEGMLRAAGDPWGAWSADLAGAGDYVGVGVWLRAGEGGKVVVAQVTEGSSASAGGLRPGDELRAVGDRTTSGMTVPAVAAALRGRAGTSVSVVVARGTALRTVVLQRKLVDAAGVSVRLEPSSPGGPLVGRITVPAFTRGVGREVREALADLRRQRAAGVVLDLRGDPGGLLDEAVQTASAFLDGGLVVSYSRRDGAPQRLEAAPGGDTRTPLVVLVDGGTASAAEVVAAALQDRDRAVLVGSRTYGKGSVQEPRSLSDGTALELTVARYTTPRGRSLEGVGLEPDIEVPPGSGPDVAVRRAVEVLTGLLATAGGQG